MAEQRRKLPPMVNDRSLFTKAAPFGNKEDPFYHSPSNRIANNYSPSSMRAASVLFEEFPSVRGAGMGRAAAAGDVQGCRGAEGVDTGCGAGKGCGVQRWRVTGGADVASRG